MQINQNLQNKIDEYEIVVNKIEDLMLGDIFNNEYGIHQIQQEFNALNIIAAQTGMRLIGELMSLGMAKVMLEGVLRGKLGEEHIEIDDDLKEKYS